MRRLALVFVLFLLTSASAAAQSSPDWQVILHNWTTNETVIVSPQGAEVFPAEGNTISLASSVNGRFVAFMDDDYAIQVGDAWELTCCTAFENPMAEDVDELKGLEVVAVNFEGTQVALATGTLRQFGEEPLDKTIVIDAEGNIIAELALPEEFFTPESETFAFGVWARAGIEMYPRCLACDWAYSGPYMLWVPGEGSSTADYGITIFGDVLPLTGESITFERNENYPLKEGLFFGPFNVINYTAPDEEPQLIYVDPDANVGSPHWVLDGEAIVVQDYETTEALVIHRDGRTESVPYQNESRFLAGTEEGWLILEPDTGGLVHYAFALNGKAHVNQHSGIVATHESRVTVVYQEQLGQSVGFRSFSPAEIEGVVAIEPDLCPDTLPSRLLGLTNARVTAGAANNVRAFPTLDSEQTGQIPGLGEFFIVDGPVCADGMNWWMVEYEGRAGWTSEGNANGYWLEPIG